MVGNIRFLELRSCVTWNQEASQMYPVIPWENMAGAAQVLLTLFALAAAGLNFLFSTRG